MSDLKTKQLDPSAKSGTAPQQGGVAEQPLAERLTRKVTKGQMRGAIETLRNSKQPRERAAALDVLADAAEDEGLGKPVARFASAYAKRTRDEEESTRLLGIELRADGWNYAEEHLARHLENIRNYEHVKRTMGAKLNQAYAIGVSKMIFLVLGDEEGAKRLEEVLVGVRDYEIRAALLYAAARKAGHEDAVGIFTREYTRRLGHIRDIRDQAVLKYFLSTSSSIKHLTSRILEENAGAAESLESLDRCIMRVERLPVGDRLHMEFVEEMRQNFLKVHENTSRILEGGLVGLS